MIIKSQNKWIIIGFFIILIISYKLTISKTIDLYKELSILKKEEILPENTPNQLLILKQKQIYFDSIFSKYKVDKGSTQNNLLQTINSISDTSNLKIVDFIEPHNVLNNNIKLNTYQFSLIGNYNTIINLIHNLEQKTKYGEIINVHFEKKINFKTSTSYLQAQVFLKSFN